jgi:hypothetical protein
MAERDQAAAGQRIIALLIGWNLVVLAARTDHRGHRHPRHQARVHDRPR